MFIRLAENKSATWEEILHSGTMPAFPDPIPLYKATTHNLLAWLDEASAEHRAVARLAKQPQWDERNKIIEDIITGVRLFLDAPDPKSRMLAEASLRSAYRTYENAKQT
jgi:hypothetical protein